VTFDVLPLALRPEAGTVGPVTSIQGPGLWRIVEREGGGPDAEPLDDGSSHPLPAEGRPVVLVRERGGRLWAYQETGAGLLLPGGQAIPDRVFTELVTS
jgi:hypothetical protein